MLHFTKKKCKNSSGSLGSLWHKHYAWPSCTSVQVNCTPVSVHLYLKVISTSNESQSKIEALISWHSLWNLFLSSIFLDFAQFFLILWLHTICFRCLIKSTVQLEVCYLKGIPEIYSMCLLLRHMKRKVWCLARLISQYLNREKAIIGLLLHDFITVKIFQMWMKLVP